MSKYIEAGTRKFNAEIRSKGRRVQGILALPEEARGVVVFAHGSGSGRFSPRNQAVADVLQEAGLGTLLVDLLEEDEAEDRSRIFDISLLAERVLVACGWLEAQAETRSLPIGLFGASTGAAAALRAAASAPDLIRAVVSRGGRPDLARAVLPRVRAPSLLIVGGRDEEVLALNREAYGLLRCTRRIDIIPEATHLFVEPGALDEVARLAQGWFRHHLVPAGS